MDISGLKTCAISPGEKARESTGSSGRREGATRLSHSVTASILVE